MFEMISLVMKVSLFLVIMVLAIRCYRSIVSASDVTNADIVQIRNDLSEIKKLNQGIHEYAAKIADMAEEIKHLTEERNHETVIKHSQNKSDN